MVKCHVMGRHVLGCPGDVIVTDHDSLRGTSGTCVLVDLEVGRWVIIRIMLVWNDIENWIHNRARSRLCIKTTQYMTHISLNHGIEN